MQRTFFPEAKPYATGRYERQRYINVRYLHNELVQAFYWVLAADLNSSDLVKHCMLLLFPLSLSVSLSLSISISPLFRLCFTQTL